MVLAKHSFSFSKMAMLPELTRFKERMFKDSRDVFTMYKAAKYLQNEKEKHA